MQPTSATPVRDGNVSSFAWSSLRIFRNVEHTAAAIKSAHNLGTEHGGNIRKQARQIRDCLVQAEEYARAAEVVTSATRPVLQYYSMMMLATAEVLFKGSGEVSLDRARERHDHHGLTLSVATSSGSAAKASDLRAKPVLFGGQDRRGTFSLWHTVSRLNPLCGPYVTKLEAGGQITRTCEIILQAPDQSPPVVPQAGLTLLECLQHIPGVQSHVRVMGSTPRHARASVSAVRQANKTDVTTVNFHPHPEADTLSAVYERISSAPQDALKAFNYPSGRAYTFTRLDGEEHELSAPNGVTLGDDTYFWPSSDDETHLNYFGWLYVAAFILGAYARYYPDKWMRDIEEATYLAAASDAFYRIAAEHGPLATLSEISRLYYVPAR